MKRKTIFIILLVTLIALIGCETHNNTGQERSGVFLTIDELTLDSGAGALATTNGSGGITAESDTVTVSISNRPKNSTIAGSDPYWLGVQLQEYQVTFYRIDGGTVVPNSVRRRLAYAIELNEQLTISRLTMLSAEQKAETPLWELAVNGYDVETGEAVIEMNVLFEFFGEQFSGEKVYCQGWTSIAYGVSTE